MKFEVTIRADDGPETPSDLASPILSAIAHPAIGQRALSLPKLELAGTLALVGWTDLPDLALN